MNESGINEDGSTWFRESGQDLGENGYRCRWTRMGGRSHDASSEWAETVQIVFSKFNFDKLPYFFSVTKPYEVIIRNHIKYHPRWMLLIGFIVILDSGGRKVTGPDTKN